ncbi:hypothetical protein [Couchioplanes caeruleus]|uniref:hypothetical protein n=1 Tax=Couchioplanes caeruleus TaxID=56438 RepID=UPI001475FB4F|nr:hypothetical protein [Couchioplanes caeruleus]
MPHLIVRATDRTGYGLRMSALTAPIQTQPNPPTPEDERQAAIEAVLRKALEDNI